MSSLVTWIAPAVLVAATLSGCAPSDTSTSLPYPVSLTVSGDANGVRSFVALQGSRTPALATSPLIAGQDGKMRATVTIKGGFDGQDMVQITREALTAGLSYSLTAKRTAPAAS